MAKDKNVNIKIAADIKDAKDGIDKITQHLNKFSKEADSKLNKFSKLGTAVSGVGTAFSMVKSAFNATKAAIDDMTAAYNTQTQAEKQLEAAAKNNPYLSDYSVDQLKKYAGELQSISTTGDEELLPMMAQLAAAGRTQAEIQDIMAASLDIAASGAMSLDTAVKQLNTTYSGSAGKLGQINSAVKGLTKEELANGEAVRIMKKQYAGIAQTVADSTGGWQQFKNTVGDIKEILGSAFANLQNSAGKVLNNFFGTIIEKLQSAGKEADEFKKKLNIISTLDSADSTLADLNGVVEQLEKAKAHITDIELVASGKSEDVKNKIVGDSQKTIKEYNKTLSNFEKRISEAENAFSATEEKVADVNKQFLAGLISQEQAKAITEQINAETIANRQKQGLLEAERNQYKLTSKVRIEEAQKRIDSAKKEVETLKNTFNEDYYGSSIAVANERKKIEAQLAEAIKKRDAAQKEADKNKRKNDSASKDEKALEIITQNNKELQKNISAINQKYELMKQEGKTIDEVAKAQEILSAQENAYLKLISEDSTLVTKNNAVAKARLAEIKESYEKVAEAIKAKAKAENDSKALEKLKKDTDALAEKAREFVNELGEQKLSAQIEASVLQLKEMQKAVEKGSDEWTYYNEKIKELSVLLDAVKRKEKEVAAAGSTKTELQKWAEGFAKKIEIVQNFADKYAEIMQGISDLVCQKTENEAKVKEAALEKQLANNEISEKEYAEKKEQIQKESAEKQYKIQMWEWGANLLNIQAQTALACVKALAEGGPYAGPAMAALIGVLGGVQLATAIANKPVPPSFAGGGVIGGYTGARTGTDDQIATVKTGEMVLNAMQQKQLWKQINSDGNGNRGNNVIIKNYAAGNASVQPSFTSQGIELLIKETVRAQMANGDYNTAMQTAQAGMSGVRLV